MAGRTADAAGAAEAAAPTRATEAVAEPAVRAQPQAAMPRTRYLFPKTPWHSPLPDPLEARPAATPPAFAPLVDVDVERRIVLHHRKRRSWLAKLARATVYGVSILLVLVAGLIATVWVEENGGIGPTAAMLVSKAVGAPDRNDNPRAEASRHELPYDGQSRDDAENMANRAAIPIDPATMHDEVPATAATGSTDAAAPAAASTAGAASGMAPAKKTATAKSEPAGGKRAATPDAATVAAAGAEQADGTASSGAGSDGKGDGAQSAAPANGADSKAASPATAKAAGAAKSDPVAKAPSKPKVSPQRVARGKEISRIQRQAAEELKKKTRGRAGSAVAAAKPAAAARHSALQRVSYTQSLARCDRVENFFRREQCKWKVCDGKWGKGGCPSTVAARFTAD